jgi:two-component system, chemotaxis family, response regulator Rcp1
MRQMHVLLVEDNPGDVRLTQEAFHEAKVPAILSVAMDGEEALAFLEKNIRSLPDLILLDLNLPKWSGKEVLQKIKNHSELKRIPVLILTTSKSEQDIMESYHLNANSYLLKPLDFDHFLEVVEKINAFWFQTAVLPPHHN